MFQNNFWFQFSHLELSLRDTISIHFEDIRKMHLFRLPGLVLSVFLMRGRIPILLFFNFVMTFHNCLLVKMAINSHLNTSPMFFFLRWPCLIAFEHLCFVCSNIDWNVDSLEDFWIFIIRSSTVSSISSWVFSGRLLNFFQVVLLFTIVEGYVSVNFEFRATMTDWFSNFLLDVQKSRRSGSF